MPPETVAPKKPRPRQHVPERTSVAIADLKLDDERLQMRSDIDQAHVSTFADAYSEEDEVPPIRVWATPEGLLPSDGYHRIEGAKKVGLEEVPALLFEGSVEEAILDAARANARVGLRRDDTAVRNSVWSVCEILGHDLTTASYKKMCGVTFRQAKKHWQGYLKRKKLEEPAKLRGLDGRWYDSAAWERRKAASPPPDGPKHERVATFDPEDDRIPTDSDVIGDDADTVEIVPDIPENRGRARRAESNGHAESEKPSRKELAERKARDDRAFLDGLVRENGKPPLRDQLPENKVQGYEREALAYRDLMQSEEGRAFLAKAEAVLGIRRGDRARGPFTRTIAQLFTLEHPRDWGRCGKCRGTGREENGPCSGCKDQAGYRV